jgi:hypothetical protein
MITDAQWERIITRQALTRQDVLVICLFAHARPELSLVRAVFDFLHGDGPAAVARGRAGCDLLLRPAWHPQLAVEPRTAARSPTGETVRGPRGKRPAAACSVAAMSQALELSGSDIIAPAQPVPCHRRA